VVDTVEDVSDVTASSHTSARGLFGWGPFVRRPYVLTDTGRNAVRLAAAALGLRAGDEVLVPAYCCGTEVSALRAAGLVVKLFPVGTDLRVKVAELEKAASSATRAVYIIHYFGFPQDVPTLQGWAKARGHFVIEDCALSLFSDSEQGWSTGELGDAAIFSFRKSFPWCRGGALVGALPAGDTALEAPSELRATVRRVLDATQPVRARLKRHRPAVDAASEGDGPLPDMPASYYVRPEDPLYGMSSLLRAECRFLDPARARSTRRELWSRWHEALRGVEGVRPLYAALPAGCCPLAYPVLVEDRPACLAFLLRKGLSVSPWWHGGIRGVEWSSFPDACLLKQSTLALPVEGVDQKQMSRFVEFMRKRPVPAGSRLIGSAA
jgi:hypothetical protein